MRLNRGSAIFMAVLAIVVIVSLIFLNSDDGLPSGAPTVAATVSTIQIFPNVSPANVSSITISATEEVGDTRPTPIPGNPTLEPPTPLPEGIDTLTTTTVLAISKDDVGNWVAGTASTTELEGSIDSASMETSLLTLTSLRSSLQFVPEDGNYAQFGLDNPNYDILFVAQPPTITGTSTPDAVSTEAQTYRLQIGNQTLSEDSYYAFLNDDTTTVYVIGNATQLRNQVLNLPTNPPLAPTAAPTIAPVLNVPGLVFQNFLIGNATGFTFTNNETGDVIEITRTVDNTAWDYSVNGTPITVDQNQLQIVLNNFSSITGVSRASETPATSVGLDAPTYTLAARDSLSTYTLQLGDQDATGSIYYSLIDDFETVVLIDAGSVSSLVSLFDNPPVPVEVTPEVTGEATVEMTAEATSESN